MHSNGLVHHKFHKFPKITFSEFVKKFTKVLGISRIP